MEHSIVSERIQKDMELLEACTATPGQGITRLPFTAEIRGAVALLTQRMRAAGLATREDAAGNLYGRLEGSDPAAPALVIGSHMDSVNFGGNFDGMAGIVVGIEVARILRDTGVTLTCPLEIMATHDEEGVRFGTGFFGAKAMMGELDEEYLRRYKDAEGVSIFDAMVGYGLDPARIKEAARDCQRELAAFLEVHIEQGPVLEKAGKQLGLVSCIVGMRRCLVTVKGRADHAGTTPMDIRADAMECAAKVIAGLGDWAREAGGEGTVATCGFARVTPNAMNIIAEEVIFSVDIRSEDESRVDQIAGKLRAGLECVCAERGASFVIEEKLQVAPAQLDAALQAKLYKSIGRLGYSSMRLPSGAGHDSLQTAPRIPTAMLFVPSKGGRSHSPVEWSEYADLANAALVLYDMLATNYGKGDPL